MAPDETLFSTVGLSPATASNPVGGTHTVTAFTQASNGTPVPGVTIVCEVTSGPNAGKTGSGSTGADGKVSFTYTDTGGPGTDTIQAFIGTALSSNVVSAEWTQAIARCDVDQDGDIDKIDLSRISRSRNQIALPDDPRDSDGDGRITSNDVKVCLGQCTRPSWATQ